MKRQELVKVEETHRKQIPALLSSLRLGKDKVKNEMYIPDNSKMERLQVISANVGKRVENVKTLLASQKASEVKKKSP